MSDASPRSSQSRPSPRSVYRSARTSPRPSPRRRPLHERSDSESNAAALTAAARDEPRDYAYGKTVFPRLPSQFLPPPPSRQRYIYEDENAAVAASAPAAPPSAPPSVPPPALPPWSTRPHPASLAPSSTKGKGPREGATGARDGWAEAFPPMSPVDSDGSPFTDDGRPWSAGPGSSQHVSWPFSIQTLASDEEPVVSTGVLAERVGKEHVSRYSFHRSESPEPAESSARSSGFDPGPRLRRVQRMLSQSSTSSLEPKPLRVARSTSFGSTGSPRQSQERRRSSTNPDGPTEAFIDALIQSGTNIQYPVLRQPSATSLRTTTSSTLGAYPPPLRLHRKRAHSQLSRAAAGAEHNGQAGPSAATGVRYPRIRPSQSTSSVFSTASSIAPPLAPPLQADQRVSGRWADEMHDTVPDLHGHTLRPQGSAYRLQTASSDSRPGSSHSTSSRPGHFYSFLNDSVTAWAHVYYRGDDWPRSETPPNIMDVEFPKTPSGRLNGSSNTSGPSQSPPSAGFPDAIYIPRVRPKRKRSESYTTAEESQTTAPPEDRASSTPRQISTPRQSTTSRYTSTPRQSSTPRRSSVPLPIFTPRQGSAPHRSSTSHTSSLPRRSTGPRPGSTTQTQADQDEQPLQLQSFNRTPELPHLSPDKRVTMLLPRWDAPSFDDERTRSGFVLNQTNRQILLFCLGFIFPLSWMLASFLPIPPRPEMTQKDPRGPYDREATLHDLYNRQEALRYQKTRWWRNLNRWMTLTGLCVVAAVITCAIVGTK